MTCCKGWVSNDSDGEDIVAADFHEVMYEFNTKDGFDGGGEISG